MESSYLPMIIGLPMFGALVVSAARNQWPRRVLSGVASSLVGIAFLATLGALFQLNAVDHGALHATLLRWGPFGDFQFDLGLLGDQVSLWFALIITGVGFLIHVYSIGYMADDPGYGRYFAELNYFIFAMGLLVLSDNFVGLLIGWANVGLASFLLIGFWNQKPEAASAAKKAFIINVCGEVGIIAALMLVFHQFGTFKYDEVFAAAHAAPEGVITAITLLLLVGAVAKSAQLPLHTWLPDAMQGPTPVSALIHAATMVTAGVYLVSRAYPLYSASATASTAVAVVGAAGALFGSIVAVGQMDIKRVLAFSTLSQIGYMFLGAGVGAYEASLFHFFTHAFFKAQLFLTAGIIIHALHGEQDMRKMGGLGKRMPFAYWSFLIGGLALAGIPPFAGFFSKDEVLAAVLESGHPVLWLMGVVAAGLTAFYVFRTIAMVFAGPESKNSRGHELHMPGKIMVYPVAILTGLAAVSGWIGIPGVTHVPASFLGVYFQRFAEVAHAGEGAAHGFNGFALAVVLLLAAVGAVTALQLYRPGGSRRQAELTGEVNGIGGWLLAGFGFDTLYRRTVIRFVIGLARFVGQWMDAVVIDRGGVHGLAGLAQSYGKKVSRLQSGYVRRYAVSLFVGMSFIVAYYFLMDLFV